MVSGGFARVRREVSLETGFTGTLWLGFTEPSVQ